MASETELQREFYRRTAGTYDAEHSCTLDENVIAIEHAMMFCHRFGLKTILDVGCGTGKDLNVFLEAGFDARGIEPVAELVRTGIEDNHVATDRIQVGQAEKLPFADASFDAVTEFSVFHHIKDTRPALREMMRVARHAIFLSDENRFGRGPMWWRLTKFAWWKLGVFPLGFWLMTKGRGYNESEGDGISYSYSVYDSFDLLHAWADAVFFIPLMPSTAASWSNPLFSSTHVLLCALRHPRAVARR